MQPTNLRLSPKHVRGTGIVVFFICATLIYILATIGNDVQHFPSFLETSRVTPFDSHFFVWSEKCRIPDVDPRHPSILPFLKPAAPIVCSRHAVLTYTAVEEGRHVLVVDKGIISQYITPERLACCYSVITRANENKNNETKCVDFPLKAILNVTVEFLYVRCRDKKKGKEVYANMHAIVPWENLTHPARTPSAAASTTSSSPVIDVKPDDPPPRLNVLILGIDSMSRLNFMRTMPRTVAHLNANDWLEFRGYNKVGDNTVPNLLGILTGLNLEQIKKTKCYPKKDVYIDKCPFIWNDFHDHGYFTAYAEDEPSLSTFNYNYGGFVKQPVDYYYRPFMLSATQKLKLVKRDSHILCLGPTSTIDHFLKLTLDLVTAHTKLFALIWMNHFSHNNHNTPAAVDGHFINFMEELKASGALNNTIILFLSDHGARFGKIRETYVGWLEERLPFIFMWLPEWFREAHPEAYDNLKARADLLTSPYDVHLALKEIVEEKVGESVDGCKGCPTCRSLFTPPVKDRDCEDAGISSHWCACASQIPTSTSSEVVLNATQFAVDTINKKLAKAGNETMSKCAILELKTVFNARLKDTYNKKGKVFRDYVIVYYTLPGLALYDATVRYKGPGRFQLMGLISRINSYAEDSKCMQDKELKLYCYCLNS